MDDKEADSKKEREHRLEVEIFKKLIQQSYDKDRELIEAPVYSSMIY